MRIGYETEKDEAHTQDARHIGLSLVGGGTGALNVRSLLGTLKMLLWKTQNRGDVMTVAYVSLERIFQVNAEQGNMKNEDITQRAVEAIRLNIRREDAVGHYGDDTLVVLMQSCRKEQAIKTMMQAQMALRRTLAPPLKNRISFSYGLVESRGTGGDSLEAMNRLIELAARNLNRSPAPIVT